MLFFFFAEHREGIFAVQINVPMADDQAFTRQGGRGREERENKNTLADQNENRLNLLCCFAWICSPFHCRFLYLLQRCTVKLSGYRRSSLH